LTKLLTILLVFAALTASAVGALAVLPDGLGGELTTTIPDDAEKVRQDRERQAAMATPTPEPPPPDDVQTRAPAVTPEGTGKVFGYNLLFVVSLGGFLVCVTAYAGVLVQRARKRAAQEREARRLRYKQEVESIWRSHIPKKGKGKPTSTDQIGR
jgi:hypothetical protein